MEARPFFAEATPDQPRRSGQVIDHKIRGDCVFKLNPIACAHEESCGSGNTAHLYVARFVSDYDTLFQVKVEF
jgi:hypothetical protein